MYRWEAALKWFGKSGLANITRSSIKHFPGLKAENRPDVDRVIEMKVKGMLKFLKEHKSLGHIAACEHCTYIFSLSPFFSCDGCLIICLHMYWDNIREHAYKDQQMLGSAVLFYSISECMEVLWSVPMMEILWI